MTDAGELARFRAEVRAFVAEKAPKFRVRAGVRSPESAEEQEQLRQWTADLFAAGYLGADWPEEYGGRGDHDSVRPGIVAEELALAHAPGPVSGSVLAAHR